MRKIFEDLVFLGKLEKDVKLYGKIWTFTTLTAEEQVEATAVTGQLEPIARINALRVQLLARSLRKIDGNEIVDKEEALEIVRSLQFPIINALYEKYEELQSEQEKSLKNIDEIKN